MTKICKKCDESKDISSFTLAVTLKNGRVKNSEYSGCFDCRMYARSLNHKWAAKYPHKTSQFWKKRKLTDPAGMARKIRNAALKRIYGITIDDYDAMFRSQNGVCFICKTVETNGRMLCVDHCHKTKKVRSLLCSPCNSLIGFAQEDISILHRASDYLEGTHTFGRLLNV